MRIIAGQWKGRRLAEVGSGDAQAHLRPTSDRVRESLFNLLLNGGYGDPVSGARVIDLFAGTGALGLEALSRGAETAVFIDNGAASRALLRANIETLRAQGRTKIFRRDATQLGENRSAPFTLGFLDPPYGQGLGERALEGALEFGWLNRDSLVVFEDSSAHALIPGTETLDQRRYGETWVNILRVV